MRKTGKRPIILWCMDGERDSSHHVCIPSEGKYTYICVYIMEAGAHAFRDPFSLQYDDDGYRVWEFGHSHVPRVEAQSDDDDDALVRNSSSRPASQPPLCVPSELASVVRVVVCVLGMC